MDLESVALVSSMALKWAEMIARSQQMLLDHRNNGTPIDFVALQKADDESRKSLVAKIEAKKQRERDAADAKERERKAAEIKAAEGGAK